MPVAAGLVLPRGAPEDAGQREDDLATAERVSNVFLPEPPQPELARVEVKEPVGGGYVDLDRVEGAGARVGAEVVATPAARNAGAEPQQPIELRRERLEGDPGVLLVRDGLVRPVEPAGAAADALVGVLRPLVVAARGVGVPVSGYEDWAR
jgi:hypothetical protein